MTINEIEAAIAANEVTPAKVFTLMRQHVLASEQLCSIYFSIAASRIGEFQVRKERDEIMRENKGV